ncbi:O-acyltransferase WSD1-like [Eucalyptus grandis]|uniref:O-acyltransferase WSD1-like n=1 Tax=Eucalyptus grandis TaxID=71139 RepID=UPI00192EC66E|nr:O-acyltransferase WSD1-like [Eucalyptus grandis]XP_039157974.1 O-acyltransferase WSD1-like [Eucalyptus grandis]
MGSPENGSDEPLTPTGRLFLQKEMNQVIYCAIGVKQPLDVEALKSAIQRSPMFTHPRFCSLMVRDSAGREHWRRTHVDIDRHVVPVHGPIAEGLSDEVAVNEYLGDLSTDSPGLLGDDKPPWDVHLLMAHRCMVFRIHHALGDGILLMSMFLASCRQVDDPEALPTIGPPSSAKRRTGGSGEWWKAVVGVLGVMWFTLVFVVEFVLQSMWVSDRRTPLSGGAGVELWPRKLATAKFLLEDMKVVKSAVANATINDVLFGIISAGFFKYLDHRCPNAVREGTRLTGVAAVNLREQQGLQELTNLMEGDPGLRWGNKFGILLLPVRYHRSCGDPLEHVRKAKSMIDRKKKSLEAHFSYKIVDMATTYLGARAATLLNYRIFCNTTFSVSNVFGPHEEIASVGNPITYMRVNTSGFPHALTMHMVSYAGRADMQILVAKDIIPDPDFLAKCFEDALLEMKAAASTALKI